MTIKGYLESEDVDFSDNVTVEVINNEKQIFIGGKDTLLHNSNFGELEFQEFTLKSDGKLVFKITR